MLKALMPYLHICFYSIASLMLYVAGECKEQLLVLAKELEKACAEGDSDKIE